MRRIEFETGVENWALGNVSQLNAMYSILRDIGWWPADNSVVSATMIMTTILHTVVVKRERSFNEQLTGEGLQQKTMLEEWLSGDMRRHTKEQQLPDNQNLDCNIEVFSSGS
eukprot:c47059_g1_i1 orf=94-429(+)